MRGYSIDKEGYLVRLRKIEGQVRSLQHMIDNDANCTDAIMQIASVPGALRSVERPVRA